MMISQLRKWSVIVLSCLEILLFGGLVQGWTSHVYVLKKEGIFSDLCANETENDRDDLSFGNVSLYKTAEENFVTSCFAQDQRFNLIFTICFAVYNNLAFIPGHMQYKLGIKKSRIITIIVFVVSCFLTGFASKENPWILIPGVILSGIAGFSLCCSNMQVGLLIPKGTSIYNCLLCACFDFSLFTLLIVKLLFDVGVQKKYSFIGIAVLMTAISGVLTILGPEESKDNHTEKYDQHEKIKVGKYQSMNSDKLQLSNGQTDYHDTPTEYNDRNLQPLSRLIFAPLYVIFMIWMCAVTLPFSYYIGAINSRMGQMFDDVDQVSYFTNMHSYCMIIGSFIGMFFGTFIQWQAKYFTGSMREVWPLSITSGVTLALCMLQFAPSQQWLYPTFIVLSLSRAFSYTSAMDFVVFSYPEAYINVLFGLSISLTGLFSLLQNVLFLWSDTYSNAVKYAYPILLVICLISFVHPIRLIISSRKEREGLMSMKH